MKHPVEGKPVSISGYFKGDMSTHLVGVLAGAPLNSFQIRMPHKAETSVAPCPNPVILKEI